MAIWFQDRLRGSKYLLATELHYLNVIDGSVESNLIECKQGSKMIFHVKKEKDILCQSTVVFLCGLEESRTC